MKKQYIIEPSYDCNVKITFYEDGLQTYCTTMIDWAANSYLSIKEKDGWVRAFSQEQYDENEMEIQDLLDELKWKRELRKEMKNNLITKNK